MKGESLVENFLKDGRKRGVDTTLVSYNRLGRLLAGDPYEEEINFLGYGSIRGYHLKPHLSKSDLDLSITDILIKAYIQYANALLDAVGYPLLTGDEQNVEFINTPTTGPFFQQKENKKEEDLRRLTVVERIIDDANETTDAIKNYQGIKALIARNRKNPDIPALKNRLRNALKGEKRLTMFLEKIMIV